MPQPPSANMGIVLPTDHGDDDVWDAILDTALGIVVDRHDHTAGKGVKIPSAALNVNADVSWSAGGTPRAITDLKAIDFFPSASAGMSGFAGALFLDSSDLELYWRTTTGVNVKVTSGAALNVAAFAGGIGGDYVAVQALFDYDDATDTYRARQQIGASVRQYAIVQHADLDLFEFRAHPNGSVPANRVRLKSPAALAASYDVTLPTALPGSTSLVQMSATGAVSVSNTIANSLTTAGITATNITATGNLQVDGNSILGNNIADGCTIVGSAAIAGSATVGGLLGANGGMSTSSATGITLSGAAEEHHQSRTITLAPSAFFPLTANCVFEAFTSGAPATTFQTSWRFGAGGDLYAHIPLRTGDRVTGATINFATNAGSTQAVTVSLVSDSGTSATVTGISSGTSTGISVNLQSFAISPSRTIGATESLMLRCQCNDGANAMHLLSCSVTWDRP